MDAITRVESLDEAFQAMRKRHPFVYHHSPELRFLYYPKDDSSALFLVATKNSAVNIEHCSQIAAEMGAFLVEKPAKSIARNGWHYLGFNLELLQLVA